MHDAHDSFFVMNSTNEIMYSSPKNIFLGHNHKKLVSSKLMSLKNVLSFDICISVSAAFVIKGKDSIL